MEPLKRLLREYSLVSGAVIATLGFVLLMEWVTLTPTQMGGLLEVIAAWLFVLRFLVTPVASPVLSPGTVVNATTAKYETATIPGKGE